MVILIHVSNFVFDHETTINTTHSSTIPGTQASPSSFCYFSIRSEFAFEFSFTEFGTSDGWIVMTSSNRSVINAV
eukprot:CAMPEP_0171415326 /NCGR_PEP_ID=MMETSP0880-20121228/39492_1 /TAXON_ID=67004 /ORGANISM="Thalassiosira weissflogii, Strain CCMP1336" /LENGTH=74 /DNA_ID=CAMNT_0011933535 /DNA_START=105 /DNA_END=329 /DNA_ORIENTATION=-